MGSTLHWREPPDRDARDFETFLEFGRGGRSGTGFMAYSDRSGPGVLVLHPPPSWGDTVLDFARAVHDDGFTVLVPDLDGSGADPARLKAAAEYLVDNWHPRLGVVGFGDAVAHARQLAEERGCDALVLYRDDEPDGAPVVTPVLSLPAAPGGSLQATLEFLHHHLS